MRSLFDGLAEVDSIALDPHKWLYLPADCGCVLCRDPASARGPVSLDAGTRVLGEAIESNLDCARPLGGRDERDLNRVNEQIVLTLQR